MRTARWMIVLLVAGCGNGNDQAQPVGTTSVPPSEQTNTDAPAAIVIVGANGSTSFSPAAVTVRVGDSVEWDWAGGPHTVTSGQPGSPSGKFCSLPSGNTTSAAVPSIAGCNSTAYAQSDGTYSHTFQTVGTFTYFSTVDGAAMVGTVTVIPATTAP